jgi:hypothetical protein
LRGGREERGSRLPGAEMEGRRCVRQGSLEILLPGGAHSRLPLLAVLPRSSATAPSWPEYRRAVPSRRPLWRTPTLLSHPVPAETARAARFRRRGRGGERGGAAREGDWGARAGAPPGNAMARGCGVCGAEGERRRGVAAGGRCARETRRRVACSLPDDAGPGGLRTTRG